MSEWKYKDSGISWIGEIPEHWQIKRFKEIFTERKDFSKTGEEDLLSVSEYYGVARRKDKMSDDDEYESRAESLVGYKICHANDLVINIMLAWKTGLGFSDFNGIVSPAYAVYKSENIVPHYYHYLMRSNMYVAEYKRHSKGIIESRLRLYTDRFNNISAICPPLSEQVCIASFLDTKTAAIDKRVAVLEKKQEVYSRLRKSIINRAVTRGLTPNVPLKDSGVDWIGMIPEHWEVVRGKDVLTIISGFPADSDLFTVDDSYIPLVRIRDIKSETTELYYEGQYPEWAELQTNDLIVGMDGDFLASKWKGPKALLNQRVCKIVSDMMDMQYLAYMIQFPLNELNSQTNSTTVKHLSVFGINELYLTLPPLSEQRAIADYLDDKCAKIDAAVENIGKQIDALKRLKRALINEVVTGKRKV